ncbi:transferrin-binding protein-like solute binding protein [Sulfitobacter sp. M13]
MKFSTFKLALATPVIAVALSACGSSNGIADYEELGNKADAVIDRVKVVGDYNEETKEYQNITTAEEMSQRSGSATYTGVAGLWVADSEEILAQRMENDADPAVVAALNLTADFDSSSITGSMTNLQTNEEDMTVSGQIDLANGSISGGDLTADLTGTIETTGDGPDETLTLVGTTTGAFVGDNAEAAVGEIEATLSNGESDGSFVGGGWIVEEK